MVLDLFGKTEIAVIYHGILTSYISNERLIKIEKKKKIVSSNVQS